MSEEKNTPTEENVENQATEETQQPVNTEKTEETQETPTIDYKAELEKERSLRTKAESRIQRLKDEKKELTGQEPQEGVLSQEDISKVLEEHEAKIEKKALASKAEEVAEKMSGSQDEKDLIMEIYQNRVKPTGDIKKDIETAYLIANGSRFMTESEEAKKALLSKQNRSKGTQGGSNPQNQAYQEPTLSKEAASLVKGLGLTFNPKENRFEGKTQWLKIDKEGNTTQGRM